ncbi:MAG: NHLP bacteriocin export ABC transporter permease/ATPase subunit [Eubacterium sp.]|nr:NHLP bacteriocin export ABC transporter permease/ATPase subunit [Eubacterium sp.]
MKKSKAEDVRYLKGGDCYLTQNSQDAYRVLSGSVLVYIVPLQGQSMGRRAFLCEKKENETIPAFFYKDMEYQSWCFCLAALEEASILCMPGMNTGPLKKKFAQSAGVQEFESDGFDDAFVNHYRLCLVRDDAYLIRSKREKQANQERTDRLISSLFMKGMNGEAQDEGQGLYQVVKALCKAAGISIAPYEKVKQCCGKHVGIMDIARVSHFPCREITLEEGWHTADAGALFVYFGEDREPAACIPKRQHGYNLQLGGKKPVKLTKKLAGQCAPKAYMIYRPFPQKSMTGKDFAAYCVKGMNVYDLVAVLLMTAISSLTGLLIPVLNQKLYDEFIPMGEKALILQAGLLAAMFMTGNIAFSIVKSVGVFRFGSHVQYQVQSAVYHRIFELPENFFRDYESADLAKRIMELGQMAGEMTNLALSVFIGIVSSGFYLWRMLSYSKAMTAASAALMILFSAAVCLIAWYQIKYQSQAIALNGKSDSIMYQFLQGIDKIRIAGIEDRAVYEYMKPYVQQRKIETSLARLENAGSIVSAAGGCVTALVLYTMAYQSGSLSKGEFAAFQTALGIVSGTVQELAGALISCRMLRPAYERVKAVLETAPEVNSEKRLPGEISGKIDLDHVSFSYGADLEPVFEDLNLHIAQGEYVGLAGSSGCGKSTLLKLLLGFETPAGGRIYYDSQDMADLNLQELRKKFGVVLQDGELISGTIYDNITLTVSRATPEMVRSAVEAAGLTEDIKNMPMGLQTIVSENCHTISGGQKQRILIARALISKPKILFFDEATSALDNLTQSVVCGTLEKMKCTRFVIAHRLSTIQNCNRILVFDEGKIVEEGNYEALMEKKGIFYELASRQLLEGYSSAES